MSDLEQLKLKIKEALLGLDCVIGWQQGFDPLHATPLFMRRPQDVDKLVFGPLCVHNLATYLPGFKGKKVGLVVKGCDSRSVVELLQEKLIKREEVVLFGLPCAGVVDLTKIRRAAPEVGRVTAVEATDAAVVLTVDGQTRSLPRRDVAADKCLTCRHHNAVLADHFVGQPLGPTPVTGSEHPDLDALEAMGLTERFAYWQQEMSRCVRCYACRNACPLCVCRDHCIAQSRDPHWVSQDDSTRDKWMFQMIHAMHLAGRCTECGECARACPVDIPILAFKKQLNRSIKELFDYEAGLDPEAVPPLLSFKVEEEHIKERGW